MYKKILLTLIFLVLLIIQPPITMNAVCEFSKKVQIIEKYCNIYDVDTEFAIAIIMTESSMRAHVVVYEKRVKEEAIGAGQILLSTARLYDKHITKKQLLDFETNVKITIKHLTMLNAKHCGNMKKITMEYNSGPRAKKNSGYYYRVKYYYDRLNGGAACL